MLKDDAPYLSTRSAEKWLVNIPVISAAMAGILINVDGSHNYAVSLLTLAIGAMSVIRARKDWYLFTIYSFIFYCTYSVHMKFYLQYVYKNDPFSTYIGTQIAANGLNLDCFFQCGMFLIVPTDTMTTRTPIRSLNIDNRDSPLLVIADLVLMLFILIFAFGTLNFSGVRGGTSSAGEFSTVFVIVGAYFSGNRKTLKLALVLIAAAYTLKGFLMGERVAGLQLILIVIFAFYAEKLSMRKLFLPAVLLFILMQLIGQSRGHFTLTGSSIENTISVIMERKFVFDTCYSGWHTSLTFLNLLDFTDWPTRIWLLQRFLLSIFLGHRLANSSLADYSFRFFRHWGGGFLQFYGQFYLGFLGVVLILAYLRFLFVKLKEARVTENGFVRCLAVYVTCSVPRWYLYSPLNITRTIMLMGIGYFMFDYTDRAIKLIASQIHASINE